MSEIALFAYKGGAMKLTKYRYVTIKSEKIVPHYSTKSEARSAIKELKIIKREVRLEKRKLQNRKKQLKTRYTKEIRQYTSLLDNKKKYRGNALAVLAFKKRKKRQLALLREPIDANQRKLEIIIAEIDSEIIKIEAQKLYMKT
jgi:DNA repair exonuclease SbcCD ATPase subunit